jgi:drug/metabolite transporter (DMT)-like permease
MGILDALAVGAVILAGTLQNPEYAVVASSVFGLVTVVLARIFLKEAMSITQWGGVIITFFGIGYLGLF